MPCRRLASPATSATRWGTVAPHCWVSGPRPHLGRVRADHPPLCPPRQGDPMALPELWLVPKWEEHGAQGMGQECEGIHPAPPIFPRAQVAFGGVGENGTRCHLPHNHSSLPPDSNPLTPQDRTAPARTPVMADGHPEAEGGEAEAGDVAVGLG